MRQRSITPTRLKVSGDSPLAPYAGKRISLVQVLNIIIARRKEEAEVKRRAHRKAYEKSRRSHGK